MSSPTADGSGRTNPDRSPNNSSNQNSNNPWNAVENLLGFLLAGFGALLSFLGLRSTEITTVLRNYPTQASLIALLLLLGILAAVLTVATERNPNTNISWVVFTAIILALFGVGAFVVYAIPIGTPGMLSKVLGLICVPAGIIILLADIVIENFSSAGRPNKYLSWAGLALLLLIFSVSAYDIHVIPVPGAPGVLTQMALTFGLAAFIILVIISIALARHSRDEHRTQGSDKHGTQRSGTQGSLHWLAKPAPAVSLLVTFIAASVILMGISAYGAMRLEANSQQSFDAQVAANVSMSASGATVSVHVTASKIKNNNYVGIIARGLPYGISLTTECEKVITNSHSVTCPENPCYYLPRVGDSCPIVINGIATPDDSGNVDETLSAPVGVGEFQDIDVQAEICSHTMRTCFPLNDNGSRVDIFLPKPQTSGRP